MLVSDNSMGSDLHIFVQNYKVSDICMNTLQIHKLDWTFELE